jgi:thiol-disulfide isomerase/thioredoxin
MEVQMRNIVLGLTIFFILFPITLVQGEDNQTQSEEVTVASVDNAAPGFSLKSLAGEEVNLSDFKGKRVIIHFWATWCPPCKWEMPAMEKIYQNANGQFEVLAINIDPENDVAGFVKELQLTFPVLLDQSGEVNETYSILSIPTTFLVNEAGEIEKKQIGAMTLKQMEEFIGK